MKIDALLKHPFASRLPGLRAHLEAQLASGKISESDKSSFVVDSLDIMELCLLVERFDLTPEPCDTVKDLLRLLKTIEFQSARYQKATGRRP